MQSDHSFTIIGIDEVGRGPLAGPVVACACVLPDALKTTPEYTQLNDSKKLTARKRERLAAWLHEHALYALGEASVTEIDEHNILQATFIAMGRAFEPLSSSLRRQGSTASPIGDRSGFEDAGLRQHDGHFIIKVDGNHVPHTLPHPCEAVIGGDGLIAEIAAASIIAKVHRDALMCELAKEWTMYGWEKNAGYGTPVHIAGLKTHGITPHHRTSFAPISGMVKK